MSTVCLHVCIGVYSDPTISRHQLYRGICISRELSGTAPPSDYLRSRQMSNSHFQPKLCKISSILVSKIITLQKLCRKRVFAQTGYTLPIKCPLSPSKFSSNCDLSAGCQSLRSVTRSRYLLIWKL